MNTVITSREAILQTCRELIRTQGWESVNIRNVAKACDISVGSIYNYFQNKSSLIAAAVESVWCDIFHMPENRGEFGSFIECVEWAYESMRKGHEKYPGFFSMHSVNFIGEDKKDGQQLMQKSWQHIKAGFHIALKRDKKINPDIFTDEFTPEKFVDIIFSLMLSSLLLQDYDSSKVVSMVSLVLYR